MEIKNYFNTNEKEVRQRKFNIVIGISLGNKYFSKDNIREFIIWATENTKEKVIFLIPDKIHAINYEVKNGYSKERAVKVASRKGEEMKSIIEEILFEFPEKTRKIFNIIKWEDIENVEYNKQVNIISKEFKKNIKFRDKIISIARENVKNKIFVSGDYEKLSEYILKELPFLISGIKYRGIKYGLLPYPGLSEIDYLVSDLHRGVSFPEITKKLDIKSKLRIVEAYANNPYTIAESNRYGKGIFANRKIKKGEVVFTVKGEKTKIPSIYTVPIDFDLYINPFPPTKFLNHSCDPSCGIKNRIEIVAMRDLEKGEEITIDYAMIVDEYSDKKLKQDIHCDCGSKNCRGEFGSYKKLPKKIKEKYKGFISDYLENKSTNDKKISVWLKLFEKNWKAKNIDGVVNLFDENVIYYESPELKLNSLDEIRKEWESTKEQNKINLEFEVTDKNKDRYTVEWKLSFLDSQSKSKNYKGEYEIILNNKGTCIEFRQYEK